MKNICALSLYWRHNERAGVSNQQRLDCLLNRLFRSRSKKASKVRATGLCEGNHRWPVDSPHKGPVTRKLFPFDDVIMIPCYWCHQNNLSWIVPLLGTKYELYFFPRNIWIRHIMVSSILATYCLDKSPRIVHAVNTLRASKMAAVFADNIYKCIFLTENVLISLNISRKFVLEIPINNIPALVQIMAWRPPNDKPLTEPMMVYLTDAYMRHSASMRE